MLEPIKKINIDTIRKEFAQRLSELIEESGSPENFFRITRRPLGRLSEWRNPRHINWPDMKSFLELVIRADVSPTWLLLGYGPKRLSTVRPAHHLNLLTEEEVITDVLRDDFKTQEVRQKKALSAKEARFSALQKGKSRSG